MFVPWSEQRLLVVAPHPDDDVLGAGGLIARVKREGGSAHVLFVTAGDVADFSEVGTSTLDQKQREIAQAAAVLGLDSWHLALPGAAHNLRLDRLPRSVLVDLIERGSHPLSFEHLKPTIVAVPEPTSYNQDHQAVAAAITTALRPGPDRWRHQPSLVLGYEEVPDSWTGSAVAPAARDVFIELSDHDLGTKISAVRAHASQCREHPHTRSEPALRALATVRGAQAGFSAAEAFRCLRWRS
ncbi:PIG-L deacetylase family protein [Nocardia sp. NPDC058379]|uniref:PIG-L deacetylase family protein n=1 Tax=unclassified Nocardia TaxID=2637762 RepID=UPI003654FFF4